MTTTTEPPVNSGPPAPGPSPLAPDMRPWQIRSAQCVIGGGITAVVGSLLPFFTPGNPDLYTISPAPKDAATFFGVVLAGLGGLMLAKSRNIYKVFGITAFVLAGLTELMLFAFVRVGSAGYDQADPYGGTVYVTWSTHGGVVIAILGVAVAGVGGMMAFRPAVKSRA